MIRPRTSCGLHVDAKSDERATAIDSRSMVGLHALVQLAVPELVVVAIRSVGSGSVVAAHLLRRVPS